VTNLWADAFRRLFRNKGAVLGLIIVALLILCGVFAEYVAPYGYTEGDSIDYNMVPTYLARILPGEMERYAKNHAMTSLAYSADGTMLAVGSSDYAVRLWDSSGSTLLRSVEGTGNERHTAMIWTVSFSPDGKLLATGSADQSIRLWSVDDGSLVRTLKGHFGKVSSVAFSPDGETLASASWDRTVQLWRVEDGEPLRTFTGFTKIVAAVAFSPDGALLASGGADKKILVWRVEDGTLVATLRGHKETVRSLSFSPDGKTLVSGAADHTVRLWQVSDGRVLRVFDGHDDIVTSVAFSPDGETLVSGSEDKTVRLWRSGDGTLLRTLKGHRWFVWAVAFSPDGETVASGSADTTTRIWRANDGASLAVLEGYGGERFVFGADYLGRDLLSRIIYGIRVSLPVGFMGALTALAIGLIYGSISGYYGGKVDNVMMRIVDIVYAFPTMLLIILLMAFFKSSFGGVAEKGSAAYLFRQINMVVDNLLGLEGGGMLFIFMGIGITAWMGIARLARGQILSIKEKEFVEASRMIGARDIRIIVRHILPNIVGVILVRVTLSIPAYITTEVFLSFIGLGVDPPTPSWGSMISEGARALRAYPNQALFPAIALALTMFAFNFLGDGLRDALDPRMRGTS